MSNSQSQGGQYVSRRQCWRQETRVGGSENFHPGRRGKVEKS